MTLTPAVHIYWNCKVNCRSNVPATVAMPAGDKCNLTDWKTHDSQSTHDQLLDERLSLGDHLSELCDDMQVLWSAFSVSQLFLCPLQPGYRQDMWERK